MLLLQRLITHGIFSVGTLGIALLGGSRPSAAIAFILAPGGGGGIIAAASPPGGGGVAALRACGVAACFGLADDEEDDEDDCACVGIGGCTSSPSGGDFDLARSLGAAFGTAVFIKAKDGPLEPLETPGGFLVAATPSPGGGP